RAALAALPAGTHRIVFTAHSIPVSMTRTAGPTGGRYVAQLEETARLVAGDLPYDLVWQSRSGPPQVPWLEPDVNDHLERLADDLEVIWDLDNEAAATAARLGLAYARAATPGTGPRFVEMIVELVAERTEGAPRRRLGTIDVWDTCAPGCCAPPPRPPR